ncbi:MAG: hypothetical protein HY922_16490 [Elusimicrobia bacterium]|nr:hypothetical protein [Elusimicrobiota bacterium]
MPKTSTSALLIGILTASLGAWAGARSDGVDKLFHCEIPDGWSRSELTEPGRGALFSGGLIRIKAARHSGMEAGRRSPEDYLAELSRLGRKVKKAGSVQAAGKTLERLSFRYEIRRRDPKAGHPIQEYVYSEFVLLPEKEGFWELRFTSTSRMYREGPRGLDAWKSFLKSFQPAEPL